VESKANLRHEGRINMGITLEDLLKEFENMEEALNYYLQCIGYTATDIENDVATLKAKIKAAKGE